VQLAHPFKIVEKEQQTIQLQSPPPIKLRNAKIPILLNCPPFIVEKTAQQFIQLELPPSIVEFITKEAESQHIRLPEPLSIDEKQPKLLFSLPPPITAYLPLDVLQYPPLIVE
jgi:hypothetical protein